MPLFRDRLESHQTLVLLRSVMDCLAVWPVRSQTQVVSPTSASTLISEHTPINLPPRNMSCPQECDATIFASKDLTLPWHSTASSNYHSADKQGFHFVETRCIRDWPHEGVDRSWLCCLSYWHQGHICNGSWNSCFKFLRVCVKGKERQQAYRSNHSSHNVRIFR